MASETTNNPQSDIISAISSISSNTTTPNIPIDSNARGENNSDPYEANDKKRNDKLKNVFHWVVVNGIRVAFFIFLAVFLVRVSHLVIPGGLRWLTESDIQGNDKLFFSGTVGGVIGRYIKVVIPNQ